MDFKNWQRDLLRIVLYAAGVIIFATAIPAFVMCIVVANAAMSPLQSKLSAELGGGITQLQLIAPATQGFVGLVLAGCSDGLSERVFPSAGAAAIHDESA